MTFRHALCSTALLLIVACGTSGGDDPTNTSGGPDPSPTTSPTAFKLDPKLAEEGQRLFNSQPCANCHGTDGTKGAAGPDLTKGDVLLRDPEVLRDYILNPEKVKKGSTMPAFEGKLSNDQINLLVQFILSHRR